MEKGPWDIISTSTGILKKSEKVTDIDVVTFSQSSNQILPIENEYKRIIAEVTNPIST